MWELTDRVIVESAFPWEWSTASIANQWPAPLSMKGVPVRKFPRAKPKLSRSRRRQLRMEQEKLNELTTLWANFDQGVDLEAVTYSEHQIKEAYYAAIYGGFSTRFGWNPKPDSGQ